MATCSRCAAETKLYDNGIPICVACSDRLAAEANQIASTSRERGYPAFNLQREENAPSKA